MTDSNRLRIAGVKEVTLGTTPGSPRMRTGRITGESLAWAPVFFTPAELRADRMSPDPTKINETTGGGINFEWSYPDPLSFHSMLVENWMLSAWVETPSRDNDGTADSVITDIQTVANTITFTTGASFVIGHLIRTTGFATAANNGVFKVTTGGATSLATTAAGWSAEAVPPAVARVKVVGIEGASADLVATSTGMTSTTMNFVNMGIVVGMWLNIGGTAAGTKFATAANNGWVRVTAVSANAMTFDNRPAGWGADAGTGKTIRIWFGDYIRNGTGLQPMSVERSFLGQTVPTYVIHRGLCADRATLDISSEAAVTGTVNFMGMSSAQGTSANGASYAAVSTGLVHTANAGVGKIAINGVDVAAPAWLRSLRLELSNNLRQRTGVGTVGAVSIGTGEIRLTGTAEVYFGDNTLYASLMAGTQVSINARTQVLLPNQTVQYHGTVHTLPRLTFNGGSPNAGGKNQDVMLPLSFETSIDTTTNCEYQMDRLEYWEV